MKKRTEQQPALQSRVFTDPTIPAGLLAVNQEFNVVPFIADDGKVHFQVEGRNIDETVNKLFTNIPVGFIDITKHLKSLRSSFYALRGGAR